MIFTIFWTSDDSLLTRFAQNRSHIITDLPRINPSPFASISDTFRRCRKCQNTSKLVFFACHLHIFEFPASFNSHYMLHTLSNSLQTPTATISVYTHPFSFVPDGIGYVGALRTRLFSLLSAVFLLFKNPTTTFIPLHLSHFMTDTPPIDLDPSFFISVTFRRHRNCRIPSNMVIFACRRRIF